MERHPSLFGTKNQIRKYKHPVCVGWGNKPSTHKSRRWAKALKIPYHQLEDGFIAYVSHPAINPQRLSLIHDTTGIYYDTRKPSDLSLLLAAITLTDTEKARVKNLINRLTEYGISKYNQEASIDTKTLETLEKNAVVIIDQTAGDASIEGAQAGTDDFFRMVEHAIGRHPEQSLYLKVHPDVLLGKKQGIIFNQIHRFSTLKILCLQKSQQSNSLAPSKPCIPSALNSVWKLYGMAAKCTASASLFTQGTA